MPGARYELRCGVCGSTEDCGPAQMLTRLQQIGMFGAKHSRLSSYWKNCSANRLCVCMSAVRRTRPASASSGRGDLGASAYVWRAAGRQFRRNDSSCSRRLNSARRANSSTTRPAPVSRTTAHAAAVSCLCVPPAGLALPATPFTALSAVNKRCRILRADEKAFLFAALGSHRRV